MKFNDLYDGRIVRIMFRDKQRPFPESVFSFQCGKTGMTLEVFVCLLHKEPLKILKEDVYLL